MKFQGDVFTQEASQHFEQVFQQAIQIQRFELVELPPAEQEQLPGEVGRALHSQLNLLETLSNFRRQVRVLLQQSQVQQDRSQDVVKIVRHSPRQLANRLH